MGKSEKCIRTKVNEKLVSCDCDENKGLICPALDLVFYFGSFDLVSN